MNYSRVFILYSIGWYEQRKSFVTFYMTYNGEKVYLLRCRALLTA